MGWGVDCLEDIRRRVGAYQRRKLDLLMDVLSTMKADASAKALDESLGPYNRSFLASQAWKQPGFNEILQGIARGAQLLLKSGESIYAEAMGRGAFKDFYEGVVKSVIRPLVNELPSRRQIAEAIAGALRPPSQMPLR